MEPLSQLEFALYDRPLRAPFRYGNRELLSRTGLLFRIHGPDGPRYAEAAPLPGHSPDSLADVLTFLNTFRSRSLLSADAPPSIRFALDSLDALPSGVGEVELNALIPWTNSGEVEALVQRALKDGYRTIKLKVFPENQDALVEVLAGIGGGDWRFRLDGNLSLSTTQLRSLEASLREKHLLSRLDYLEDISPDGSPEASWAVDESAGSVEAIRLLLRSRRIPDVFVLKPTVLGGLGSLAPVLEAIHRAGKRAIFSSSFESEVGRRAILRFIAGTGSREAHGLSVGGLFAENFLPDRARIKFPLEPTAEELNFLRSLPWGPHP